MIEVFDYKTKQSKLYENLSEVSDGYHTFEELYEFRTLYNAGFLNALALLPGNPYNVHKSIYHSDGQLAFGGRWFIVVAELPTGQITNHYPDKHWDLFALPIRGRAAEWDGHTAEDVIERLRGYLVGRK